MTDRRLYYHKTDGGAEYLCTKHIKGSDEGDIRFSIIRLDGKPKLLKSVIEIITAFPIFYIKPNEPTD